MTTPSAIVLIATCKTMFLTIALTTACLGIIIGLRTKCGFTRIARLKFAWSLIALRFRTLMIYFDIVSGIKNYLVWLKHSIQVIAGLLRAGLLPAWTAEICLERRFTSRPSLWTLLSWGGLCLLAKTGSRLRLRPIATLLGWSFVSRGIGGWDRFGSFLTRLPASLISPYLLHNAGQLQPTQRE
jgi:hypothetical protein